jgi:hypothetical protein
MCPVICRTSTAYLRACPKITEFWNKLTYPSGKGLESGTVRNIGYLPTGLHWYLVNTKGTFIRKNHKGEKGKEYYVSSFCFLSFFDFFAFTVKNSSFRIL